MARPGQPNADHQVAHHTLFREVNERIHALLDEMDATFGDTTINGKRRFVCECDRSACEALVVMSRDDYGAIRARSDHFFVLAGHENPALTRVVESRADWRVVELVPTAA